MKKFLLGIMLLLSSQAMADSSQCKRLYESHYERLRLIQTLLLKEEISAEFFDARMADEVEIMKVSIPVMCKGVSKKERNSLKLEAWSEIGF